LYSTFTDIVSAETPKEEYVNSDIGTRYETAMLATKKKGTSSRFFFGLLGWLPTSWSDRARISIMQLPALKKTKKG